MRETVRGAHACCQILRRISGARRGKREKVVDVDTGGVGARIEDIVKGRVFMFANEVNMLLYEERYEQR
jgi:hypothetical protein